MIDAAEDALEAAQERDIVAAELRQQLVLVDQALEENDGSLQRTDSTSTAGGGSA